ncbi:hypothetical protein HanRHA438_Chr16g0770501 [Helianthus annuus]|nr:hypothetical protein HanRHA438_Chr16g0770501 [Helianthus annuus]
MLSLAQRLLGVHCISSWSLPIVNDLIDYLIVLVTRDHALQFCTGLQDGLVIGQSGFRINQMGSCDHHILVFTWRQTKPMMIGPRQKTVKQ